MTDTEGGAALGNQDPASHWSAGFSLLTTLPKINQAFSVGKGLWGQESSDGMMRIKGGGEYILMRGYVLRRNNR